MFSFVFKKAGICEHQLLLALEPETAALFCRTLPDQMINTEYIFEPGARYMVLDLGGISNHSKHQIEIINSQQLQTNLIHNFT